MFRKITNWINGKIKDNKRSIKEGNQINITDHDGVIRIAYSEGATEEIPWKEITRISIHTNDSGPWGPDLWWILEGKNTMCIYPQGATGASDLVPKFQKLEGFDNRELINAMACTSNSQFTCWENKD